MSKTIYEREDNPMTIAPSSMAELGYKLYAPGILIKDMPNHWGYWISIEYTRNHWDVRAGILNALYDDIQFTAKQVFNSSINKVRKIPNPIFIASSRWLSQVVDVEWIKIDNERSLKDAILDYIEPALAQYTSWPSALQGVEAFSRNMQSYEYSKCILLRILGNHDEFSQFTAKWIDNTKSMNESLSLLISNFVVMVENFEIDTSRYV